MLLNYTRLHMSNENGKQVSKELVHTSTYAMAPTTTLVGTKNTSSSTKKSPSKDKDKKSE